VTARLVAAAVVVALASIPLWMGDPYVLHVLIMAGIFTIAAMSLNLLLGYAGQLSLGHVAFFGVGAYASALFSLGFRVHVLPAWCWRSSQSRSGSRCSRECSPRDSADGSSGRIAFKVRGAYFVIVSISFAEVARLVAVNWVELTQGPMALNNIPALSVAGFAFLRKPSVYWLVLGVAIACFILIARLVHSRAGRAMVALSENEALATSVGIDVTRYLVLATVVAATMAGAGGRSLRAYVRIVDPDVFSSSTR
jgi:branched-chain amino acid transport system permease protein